MNEDALVPLMIFGLPMVAITGGVAIAAVRAIGQQRLMEMAQRERLAAIERGIDPEKLPPPPWHAWMGPASREERALNRSQNMTIGGLICVFVGIALGLLLYTLDSKHQITLIGLLPVSLGLALLVGGRIVAPRRGLGPEPPRA
jgi:hypothetical protein